VNSIGQPSLLGMWNASSKLLLLRKRFYALLAATGLRVGEALGLEIQHFIDDTLNIQQALWNGRVFTPTENGIRVVDLPQDFSQKLRQFIGTRRSGFIFQTENGGSLHQSNVLRLSLHPLLAALKIPKQGYHGFRRFRITHLRKQRIAEDLIRFWAGHSNKSVTDGYVRLADDEQFRRSAVEQAGLGFRLDCAQLFSSVPLTGMMNSNVQTLVI
jgi:integrase